MDRLVGTVLAWYQNYSVVRYLYNLFLYLPFLLVDFAVNTLAGNSPQETVSGWMGRNPGHWFSRLISPWLDKIDPGHCKKWAQPDAADEEVPFWVAQVINTVLIFLAWILFFGGAE